MSDADRLTTRQCFSGIHDQCKRTDCQCACHDVRTRYRNDPTFHQQVDVITQEAVRSVQTEHVTERQYGARIAREAIILWLERFGL